MHNRQCLPECATVQCSQKHAGEASSIFEATFYKKGKNLQQYQNALYIVSEIKTRIQVLK